MIQTSLNTFVHIREVRPSQALLSCIRPFVIGRVGVGGWLYPEWYTDVCLAPCTPSTAKSCLNSVPPCSLSRAKPIH